MIIWGKHKGRALFGGVGKWMIRSSTAIDWGRFEPQISACPIFCVEAAGSMDQIQLTNAGPVWAGIEMPSFLISIYFYLHLVGVLLCLASNTIAKDAHHTHGYLDACLPRKWVLPERQMVVS